MFRQRISNTTLLLRFAQSEIVLILRAILHRSHLSATHAEAARHAVLSFFSAPPGYTVIFTANASAALKLVGEAFPFTAGSCYMLGADSHNSVHGIRQYALKRGASVHYIESNPQGGMDINETLVSVKPFNDSHSSLIRPC